MNKAERINEIGEKLSNEWGINNAKALGLEVCTIAAMLEAENADLRAQLAAEKKRAEAAEKLLRVARMEICFQCRSRAGGWGIEVNCPVDCVWRGDHGTEGK